MLRRRRTPLAVLELDARINPVANDLFADAELLTGQSAQTFGQNYDIDSENFDPFTGEAGEPDHAGVSAPLQSAWYVWTAPITGRARVDLDEFNGNAIAGAVYTGGAVDTLTAVASGSEGFSVSLTFDAVAGTTYHVAVDSPGDGLVDYQLTLAEFIPPANDAFAAAFPISGAVTPVAVAAASTLAGADFQPGEPNHAAGLSDHGFQFTIRPSVWYTWTAPTTGRATVALTVDYDLSTSNFLGVGTAVAVYTGGAVDALTKVANAEGSIGPLFGTNGVNVTFNSVAGTTYRIAAAGYARLPSVVNLKVINQAVPGAVAVNGTVYVVGTGAADTVRVAPFGPATDGSSGVVVSGRVGGQSLATTVSGTVTAAELYLYDGTNTVDVTGSLAFALRAELGNGANTLRGGAGDTSVLAGNGTNVIRTGAGKDSLILGRGNNVVTTGAGDDEVRVDSPRVIFFGDPVPPPGTGANVIDAGAGNNSVVVTTAGPTVVATGAGNDAVNVFGGGPAVVTTGDGNDFVAAGGGNHVISTGAGNDTVRIGATSGTPTGGTNVVDAGAGDDRVTVTSTGPTVVFAGAGDDDVTIGARSSFDTTPFQSGPSTVFGGAGSDVLLGGNGNDFLDGGDGNDLIAGGLGADFISGGAGNDLLFDGTVAAKSFAVPLRKVLADWNPADPASYATARGRITVTADTASRDVLVGGAGTDWFWSADPLDVLDLGPGEVRN